MRKTRLFVTSIHVRGIDRIGLLNDVTHVFSSELQLNIMKVNIDCMDGIFDAHFSFRIHDREEVANIINRLKQISDLQEISQE
jgi:GTP pyrophosphokinase